MTPQMPERVGEELVRVLRLDLVGPAAHHPADVAYAAERLP